MNSNRPQGRKPNISGTGKPIQKRGSGLGTGPVGQPGGSARKNSPSQSAPSGQRAVRASGGSPLLKIIIALVAVLGGGGAGLGTLLGNGGGNDIADPGYVQSYEEPSSQTQSSQSSSQPSSSVLNSLLGINPGTTSTGWDVEENAEKIDESVDPSAREKYTHILGGGKDTVTIMLYMCGSDLESKNGMGTADIVEMTKAQLNDKVNLILFTGGAKQWKNKVVSANVNQIYKVQNGGLRCLNDNAGNSAMTDPKNLSNFIEFCAENFPASRYELIFWNHGGGSISGYGYDEKNPRSGSMPLKGIDTALSTACKNADIKFDFIGFDACLMATLENALTLTPYADYLVASEETEPGVGWYYTDWLTKLSSDTSMSTVRIGQNIVDDFVEECARKCGGQKTTLSVIDLAQLENTVPEKFKAFATNLSELITGDDFKAVSNARASTREFAASSKIDQIDLVHLANNLGTDESKALANALLKTVKYNRTSSNMTNSYGISIYFPYQKAQNVSNAVAAYNAIGLDDEYSRCIQQFASMEAGAQSVSGGVNNPIDSLLGASNGGSIVSSDLIGGLLSQFLGRAPYGKSLDPDSAAAYIAANRFDPSQLMWTADAGGYKMTLDEDQWSLVHTLLLNVFYDDGEGYIDLGLDNVFDFTSDGSLVGNFNGSWVAVDERVVPYYYMDTVYEGDDYVISGRVPCLYNGDRAELIIVFDSRNDYGYIAGVRLIYRSSETDTIAKSMTELTEGDKIDFICDYYSYEGEYMDSYLLGDEWVYHEDAVVNNVMIDAENVSACYLFTDIYNQQYWTPVIP